jgi:hypothetical protein
MLIAAGAALVVSNPAAAQGRCYEVIDLGPIGFLPGGAGALFGINNNDQGVFTAEVNGKKHAILYLPTDAFDLTAGCIDLHDLANLGPTTESVAHDISDAGIAVGWAEIAGERHAFVWRVDLHDPMGNPPVPSIDLGTFQPNGTWSEAWAINNVDPPIIVGEGEFLAPCGCEGPAMHDLTRGFALELTGANPTLVDAAELVQDGVLPCAPNTYARDVLTPPGGGVLIPLTVAGYSVSGGGFCPAPGGCGDTADATVWTNPTPPSSPNPGKALVGLSAGGTQAWGVSDLRRIVGTGYTSANVGNCQEHALFWRNPLATPADLATVPGIPEGSQPKAYRINNLADIDVVGRSSGVLGVALLWECSAGCGNVSNWTVFDLNTEISDCVVGWTLRRADDVNDNGLIIGSGHRQGQGTHAFILEPQDPCCPADLDGDGNVGVKDLLILIGNWGPCPDCGDCGVECVGDLDCDCSVGVKDQNTLLGAWGSCDGSDGGSSEAVEQAVQEMGYDDLEDYHEWLAQASDPEALASGWVLYTILPDQE